MDHAVNQNLFLNIFPFEIATKIFSYLRQNDCLTCMAVCRSWYLTVPHYSRDLWTNVYSMGNIYTNQRWERCVGEHVRKVIDFSGQAHKMLQRLIDCGCTQVKAVELRGRCEFDDNLVLLLNQIASGSLVELFVDGCSYGKTFFHLLKAFPHLQRFALVDDRYHDPDFPLFTGLPDLSQELSLTRLFIKYTRVIIHDPLVTVLKKCPHLQFLAYDRTIINLDQLFSWCPKLVYLEADPEDLHRYRLDVINRLSHDFDGDAPGLRAFIGRDSTSVPPSMIGYHLMRNAGTLEHLVLGTSLFHMLNWSTTLKDMRFPRLRTFIDMSIDFNDGAMDAMLSSCPSLTKLILLGPVRANINLQALLSSVPQLEIFHLRGVGLSYNNAQTMTQLFEQLAASGSRINDVALSRIEPIPDALLLALPLLPSLKHLEIDLSPSVYTDEVLCQSIQLFGRTSIESLYFRNLRCVPETAVIALYELPCLKKLRLHGSNFNVKPGVGSLLQIFEHCSSLKSLHMNGLVLTGSEGDSAACFEQNGNSYAIDSIRQRNGCYSHIFLHATNKIW